MRHSSVDQIGGSAHGYEELPYRRRSPGRPSRQRPGPSSSAAVTPGAGWPRFDEANWNILRFGRSVGPSPACSSRNGASSPNAVSDRPVNGERAGRHRLEGTGGRLSGVARRKLSPTLGPNAISPAIPAAQGEWHSSLPRAFGDGQPRIPAGCAHDPGPTLRQGLRRPGQCAPSARRALSVHRSRRRHLPAARATDDRDRYGRQVSIRIVAGFDDLQAGDLAGRLPEERS